MTDQDHLERINALTRNARATWFTLLAALVFVGITLMGVEHIDFHGIERTTQLPLVGVEVSTRRFFYTAPILIAAIYGYFQLYLIRLWVALGAAPSRLNGVRLGDAITPWLVSDAALHFRNRERKDGCTTPRALDYLAMQLNRALALLFGPFILVLLWLISLPARDFWVTVTAVVSLVLALISGLESYSTWRQQLQRSCKPRRETTFGSFKTIFRLLLLVAVLMLAGLSYATHMGFARIDLGSKLLHFARIDLDSKRVHFARIDLTGAGIVERPQGWQPHDIARRDFLETWCKREAKPCELGALNNPDRAAFEEEWRTRRAIVLADLRKPDWHEPGQDKPDLRGAVLRATFLVGLNLYRARLDEANLRRAEMEGAILIETQMREVNLSAAQMAGAKLHRSMIAGRADKAIKMRYTDLSAAKNDGGALRFVDLSEAIFDPETDFRNVFLDDTVQMTPEFRAQMGNPCQWADAVLNDAEFYGRWRGWIEADPTKPSAPRWARIAPDGFADVKAIRPPTGCTWQTGPMPGVGE